MGFYCHYYRRNSEKHGLLFVWAFASLAVETVQFIFTVGSADIDDLILNTMGAWLGYLAYKGILIKPKNEKSSPECEDCFLC